LCEYLKQPKDKTIPMAEDRISAPQSSAGLVRYYDVTSSKVRITPQMVVGFSILVIVIEIVVGRLMK